MEETNDEGIYGIYTVPMGCRGSLYLKRALMNAAAEKHTTESKVIICCLTGKENLTRYIDAFDESDFDWIHGEEKRILKARRAKR